MRAYIIRRLVQGVVVALGATFVIFLLVYALPGDPAQALAGERAADPAFVAALRERYNLDEPLVEQYGLFMWGLVQGDLGETYSGLPVSEQLRDRLGVSARLAGLALLMEAAIGMTAGILAALGRGRLIDNLVRVSTLLALSVPFFVTAFVLQLVVGVKLGWLPVAGVQAGLRSYILPAFVLASLSMAYVARLTRDRLIEALGEDYVRTATAKGLSHVRVVGKHALRNSLIPVVTFLGLEVGTLLNGTVITESIFNLPGVGQGLARAIYLNERTTVVGFVTALVVLYIVINILVDLLYAVLDPRIRYA